MSKHKVKYPILTTKSIKINEVWYCPRNNILVHKEIEEPFRTYHFGDNKNPPPTCTLVWKELVKIGDL